MSFRNLSIRKKLTALMMIVSVFILLLVSGFYLLEEYHSSRAFLEREMNALGTAIGKSCKAPLMQRDISTTEQILSSLDAQANVRAAYLFDEVGDPVAEYIEAGNNSFVLKTIPLDFVDPNDRFWLHMSEPRMTMGWQHYSLFVPIQHDDRQVGSLYLLSDLQDLYDRFRNVVFIVLSMSGLLMFLSWWLAGRLQRPVSVPLLNLVETMETISHENDYSLRAQKQGQDEIGLLVDGFNQMLEQIEQNRQELVEHKESLEITVEKRTEELRQMVAVLEIAKQQAEAASEAKSQFLANITHELRTPLIGVLGMNELMFRTSMNEQQQMLATTVQNSGENLLTLINNVLDFSKIEAGKMQLEEQEFYLYKTVDDVLNLLSGPAEDKGLSLYSDIPLAATCRVLGDEVRLRQIVMNLVGNAIKFTEKGSVSLRLGCDFPDAGTVAFTLEVVDTGIGMDEGALKQVFSAFQQADASHTRKYGGTGLGLAIVQQLVALLDGDLSVDSRVGEGSCFKISFSLPLVEEADLQLPESLQNQKVLLCSDDETCRQVLANRLTALSLDVFVAQTAADGWYQLNAAERQQQPFALAFLAVDCCLPEGLELYKALRDHSANASLRRILLLSRHQVVEQQGNEQKLYMPVGWDALHESLCRSWNQLHLVESSQDVVNDSVTEKNDRDRPKILLAGGNVASRELIKVGLRSLQVDFDTASGAAQLREKLTGGEYVVVLLDSQSFTAGEIVDIVDEKITSPLLFLLDDRVVITQLEKKGAAVLEKPVKQDHLLKTVEGIVRGSSAALGAEGAVHE
ncbi:ATP-binding protein [Malonomonas rubra]|uniref:ATP-binding protein n=1 Tax=Malonomonas rubra TaxID=57040 RepID=UPI001114BB24|nr:ATP-binding protein [Malonomonas rubra]